MASPEAEELALQLIRKAEQDELLFDRLIDDPAVHDSLLGYHAQQAVEKRIKAVLALREIEYERSHNLSYLSELLDREGVALPPSREAAENLTPWAVVARYEDTFEGALDREAVQGLLADVRKWSHDSVGPTDALMATGDLLRHFSEHGGLDHLALLTHNKSGGMGIHVTLDSSVWCGYSTALNVDWLMAEVDTESGEEMDISGRVDTSGGMPSRIPLEVALAVAAEKGRIENEAMGALVVARFADDGSFAWASASDGGIAVGEAPANALSRFIVGVDALTAVPVLGGIWEKPDPDVRPTGPATVELDDVEAEELAAVLSEQQAAFLAKFGRPMGPDDPVFFNPDSDEPEMLSADQMSDVVAAFEELGGPDLSKRVATEKVLAGRIKAGHLSDEDGQGDASPYHDINPLPFLMSLEHAAALEGPISERMVHLAVHSWAEGHLAASGHPPPSTTDEPLHVPPFPAVERDHLGTILKEAARRFPFEGIEVLAYTAALAWAAGRAEGAACEGCAIERAESPIAQAARDGELVVRFHPS